MPPLSPNPIPSTNFTVTGNVVANAPPNSGNLDVTAVGSGPWRIEQQSLDCSYERVPRLARHDLVDRDVSLSSVNCVSGDHTSTVLAIKWKASYSVVSSDAYFTSGLQIPQTFEVQPVSADYQGNTYGDLSYLSGHLGPQGSISTASGWYSRRLWVSATDVEVTRNAEGLWNFQVFPYTYTGPCGPSGMQGGALGMVNNFRAWIGMNDHYSGYSDLDECGDNVYWMRLDFLLPGEYAVAQETNARVVVIGILDTAGEGLQGLNAGFYDNEGINVQSAIPEYRSYRHDYS